MTGSGGALTQGTKHKNLIRKQGTEEKRVLKGNKRAGHGKMKQVTGLMWLKRGRCAGGKTSSTKRTQEGPTEHADSTKTEKSKWN